MVAGPWSWRKSNLKSGDDDRAVWQLHYNSFPSESFFFEAFSTLKHSQSCAGEQEGGPERRFTFKMSQLFSSSAFVYSGAILLRVVLLFYGIFQDKYSAFKYTDIDYFVFTDAARFMSQGRSPYDRETYRYTPLLAWLLLPTTWSRAWFSFGKVLFAVADIVAGYLIVLILKSSYRMTVERALRFASIWLLNPMVATISTRGSSEGLLGVLAVGLLWAVTEKRVLLAGCILGFAVHFKIYPFIYAVSIVWWLDDEHLGYPLPSEHESTNSFQTRLFNFVNRARLTLALSSLSTFMALNGLMYSL